MTTRPRVYPQASSSTDLNDWDMGRHQLQHDPYSPHDRHGDDGYDFEKPSGSLENGALPRASNASTGYTPSYYLSPLADKQPGASSSTLSLTTTNDDGRNYTTEHLPTITSYAHERKASQSGKNKAPGDGGGGGGGVRQGARNRGRTMLAMWKSTLREALFPESLACRLYLIVVLLETFLDVALEAVILHRVNQVLDHQRQVVEQSHTHEVLVQSRVPVYLSIFGIAHVFQFALALDAVYYKNVLQFIFLALFNALFFVYAVIQIFEVRDTLGDHSAGWIPSEVLTISIPVVVAVAEIAYIALGYKIYREFGWQVFKFLGADRKVRRLFTQYQIFECLVRFDAFFWLGFSVQLISLVLSKNDFEFYLTIAAVPLCMLLLFEGHLGARHESVVMMSIFAFGLLASVVYFSYKLFRIWSQRHTDAFKDVYKTLSVFAALSIILLLLTAVWAYLVFRNFHNGLKTAMDRNANEKRLERLNRSEADGEGLEMEAPNRRFAASANPNRMSIY